MRGIPAGIAAILVVTACSSAAATCKCRAPGIVATEGQTLCIKTPGGVRLARCGKVSNVSSWTFIDGPCPQAALNDPAGTERSLLSRWTGPRFRP